MPYRFGKTFGCPTRMWGFAGAVWLTAGLALAPAAMVAAAARAQPAATFRSGVDLVTVNATVRDAKGRLVTDLTRADFEVYDGGVLREVSEFRAEPMPLSLAILFDVSGSMSMAARATAAKFAAYHLLAWLQDGRDEAALFAFDSRLHEVAPFTVDMRALRGTLGEVDPFGATSLHDAILDAARHVSERTGRRRAVVVLTDGIDTASRLTAAEVSGKAAAIDVPVYVIATVLGVDDPASERGAPARPRDPANGTVEDLARWTGGALYYTSTPASASHAARAVVDELRHAYLFAFPPGAEAGWHPLEVRAKRKDLVVRTRGGYVR